MRNAFIGPQSVKCCSTSGRLVRHHTTNGAPKDLGWGLVMQRAMFGVGVHPLPPELGKLELVPEQGAGNVDVLRANADDSLSIEKLLSHGGCQTAEEVAATINNNFCFEGHRPGNEIHTRNRYQGQSEFT